MRLFTIAAGTPIHTIDDDDSRILVRPISRVTKREMVFELEDVVVDPLGRVAPGPIGVTIGNGYAKAGWYGFNFNHPKWNGTVLVSSSSIQIS